jgi:hypothetical protein
VANFPPFLRGGALLFHHSYLGPAASADSAAGKVGLLCDDDEDGPSRRNQPRRLSDIPNATKAVLRRMRDDTDTFPRGRLLIYLSN